MHELSLCRSIHTVVERSRSGRAVETVHVRVGKLRQVVPDTLVYCWSLVTEDTTLAGSQLVVDSVPITVTCKDCLRTTGVAHELFLVCGGCHSANIEVTSGEEFMVTSIDVSKERVSG